MKISKKIAVSVFILILIFIILVVRFAYFIGEQDASLKVQEATPKQLAQYMSSDNFYGNYAKTMLYITGIVESVSKQGSKSVVQFKVTDNPTVLGKVSCSLLNSNLKIKAGDKIKVLTVAYDAQRQNRNDVFLENCYLLNF